MLLRAGKLAVVVAFACLLQNPALAAKRESVEVEWNDLDQLISGRKVALCLPDSTDIEGKVLSVAPDGLVMQIRKTSDAQAHAKGQALIPRSSVTALQLKKTKGPWRTICTTIGAGGGFLLGGFVSVFVAPERSSLTAGTKAAFVAVMGGLAIVGYLVGRKADRKVIIIRVIQEVTKPREPVATSENSPGTAGLSGIDG